MVFFAVKKPVFIIIIPENGIFREDCLNPRKVFSKNIVG